MELQDPQFIKELEGLAALAAQRPELRVVVGDDANGTWNFNWRDRLITANGADLALRPPDFSRGLILHEAAHAGVTRLWDMLPADLSEDMLVHTLNNTIEDCRIERWLQRRLPGSAPWIRLYNDTLFAGMLTTPRDEMDRDKGGAFLNAILCRWWYGRDPEHLPQESLDALNETWSHIQLAIEACPPFECPEPRQTLERYSVHPVSVCYRGMDHAHEPEPLELEIRMAQHEMWEIVWQRILPVFRRLIEQTQSPLGKLAKRLLKVRAMIQRIETVAARPAGGLNPVPSLAVNGGGARRGGLGHRRRESANQSARDYHEAIARHHASIEMIVNALLRYFTAEAKMRFRGHYSSGQGLDVRRAMQYEADPRLHDRLWLRMTLPTRPDPAFIILADASGSMSGPRAHATFDALVMLRESCLRLGLPLSIVTFDTEARCLQPWHEVGAGSVVEGLCRLRNDPSGGTDMVAGLELASGLLDDCPQRDRHLWILSDGEPHCMNSTRQCLQLMQDQLASITGLGLGPDTESMKKLVPSSLTNLDPSRLPSVAGRLFHRMARGAAAVL